MFHLWEIDQVKMKNNIFGTRNVTTLADKYTVKRFMFIHIEKAVNQINIMIDTKRTHEIIIKVMNKSSEIEFVDVRLEKMH